MVWKLGREKASTRVKVGPLVVCGTCRVVGAAGQEGLHLASAASGSFWKAAGASSTLRWLNSPRLSARSGKGDVLGTLQGRRQ